MSLSTDLHWHRERLVIARQHSDLGAVRLNDVRGPFNRRKEEQTRIIAITEQEQIDKILTDLCSYIGALRKPQISNWERKTKILWARYVRGLPWPDVIFEVYGDQPDFERRKDSYKRQVYRLHEKALDEIWHKGVK